MVGRRTVRAPKPISAWPFVGMAMMASVFFLYAASGLVAPPWAVVLLLLVWAGLFLLCVRWWTPHPKRLPFVALGATVFWYLSLVAGAALLGWNA